MFKHATYIGINAMEHIFHFAGKYGCKGEKRASRKKKTPEQMAKQNQINKENKVRRIIAANFYKNDYWVCLKYPKGTRKSVKEVSDDLSKFIRKLRKEYKERGEALKYIYRIEVGKQGGIHVHMLMNRIWMLDILISKHWPGHINITPVYELGSFRKLASYICKPLPKDDGYEQLSFIEDEYSDSDIKAMSRYSASRNLIRPEPEVKTYTRRTMRKLIDNGPVAHPGFYIDKDSIHIGVNAYTGYSYMYYTELRVNPLSRPVKMPNNVDNTSDVLPNTA